MADIIEILCWFVNLLRGFFEVFGIDTQIIDDVTGAIIDFGNKA